MPRSQPRRANGQFAPTGTTPPAAAPDIPAAAKQPGSASERSVADTYAAFQQATGSNGGGGEVPVGISGDAYVSDDALVYDDARVYGDAHVQGNAEVHGDAEVHDNALVYDNAKVFGNAEVHGNALVYGDARVSGDAEVHGNTLVYGDARVSGDAHLAGFARVHGDAEITAGYVAGHADVFAPHHVQTWRDRDGELWTVTRSSRTAGFEVRKGSQAATGALPAEVSGLTLIVTGEG